MLALSNSGETAEGLHITADALRITPLSAMPDAGADTGAPDTGGEADGGVTRPPSVLVAEDNPVNQMVIEAMLEEFGCLVRIAEDGAAALDALEEGGFDLVFMDCQMPIVDGFRTGAPKGQR